MTHRLKSFKGGSLVTPDNSLHQTQSIQMDQLDGIGQAPHAQLVMCRAIEAFSQGHTENTQDIAALLAQCNLDVTGQVSVRMCRIP